MAEPGKHPLAISVGGVAAAVVSVTVYTGWFWTLFWIVAHVVLAFLGFYYAVQWNLVCGKRYKPQLNPKLKSSVNIIIQKMIEFESACVEPPKKVVISRSLDNALQEVIDLACRHFILAWYEPLTKEKRFVRHTQAEVWRVIDRISRRMSEIDLVSFLSQDVLDCLHQHFKHIRLAKKDPLGDKNEESSVFILHSWLRDEEKELECLRKVSDVILLFLLSKPYGTCAPIRHLVREIVSGSDLDQFKSDARSALPDHNFITPDTFNSALRNVLDVHAPLTTRTVRERPISPCFCLTIKQAKQIRRRAERRWNKTKLTVHAEIYKATRNKVTKLVKEKKREYYNMVFSNTVGPA
ncbi:sorting nexin-25 [Elysia marginata]|uniref:Sorting nexin-25 n=1 Tax=Elysia marginata TaxID=1093978 RepID=A0AAV4IPG7_9GAST|nr:sorting nexin-25 [Elysia marginata]